ncbi:MAG: hydroxyacylglutathione hydrolase, partial [Flavobacterium sp.]
HDTQIYCTHEYTETNLNFVQQKLPRSVEVDKFAARVKDLRHQGQYTVPFPLRQELELNPFLRAKSLDEFAHLRSLRNKF